MKYHNRDKSKQITDKMTSGLSSIFTYHITLMAVMFVGIIFAIAAEVCLAIDEYLVVVRTGMSK